MHKQNATARTPQCECVAEQVPCRSGHSIGCTIQCSLALSRLLAFLECYAAEILRRVSLQDQGL